MEIERKFMVNEDSIPNLDSHEKSSIAQGYLSFSPEIRIRKRDDNHFLTVKGEGTLSREEYETEISEIVYKELLSKVQGITIDKIRYKIRLSDGYVAELDIYKNIEGLHSTVEVEFKTEEISNKFEIPEWFGPEVTQDKAYKNKNLAKNGCVNTKK